MRRRMIAWICHHDLPCVISHEHISHGYLFSGPVSAILQRLVDRSGIKAFSSPIEEKVTASSVPFGAENSIIPN